MKQAFSVKIFRRLAVGRGCAKWQIRDTNALRHFDCAPFDLAQNGQCRQSPGEVISICRKWVGLGCICPSTSLRVDGSKVAHFDKSDCKKRKKKVYFLSFFCKKRALLCKKGSFFVIFCNFCDNFWRFWGGCYMRGW